MTEVGTVRKVDGLVFRMRGVMPHSVRQKSGLRYLNDGLKAEQPRKLGHFHRASLLLSTGMGLRDEREWLAISSRVMKGVVACQQGSADSYQVALPLLLDASHVLGSMRWQPMYRRELQEVKDILSLLAESLIGASSVYKWLDSDGYENPQRTESMRKEGFYATASVYRTIFAFSAGRSRGLDRRCEVIDAESALWAYGKLAELKVPGKPGISMADGVGYTAGKLMESVGIAKAKEFEQQEEFSRAVSSLDMAISGIRLTLPSLAHEELGWMRIRYAEEKIDALVLRKARMLLITGNADEAQKEFGFVHERRIAHQKGGFECSFSDPKEVWVLKRAMEQSYRTGRSEREAFRNWVGGMGLSHLLNP